MQIFLCSCRSLLTSICCILLVSHIKPFYRFNLLSQRSRNKYCNNKGTWILSFSNCKSYYEQLCSLGGFVEHKIGPRLKLFKYLYNNRTILLGSLIICTGSFLLTIANKLYQYYMIMPLYGLGFGIGVSNNILKYRAWQV